MSQDKVNVKKDNVVDVPNLNPQNNSVSNGTNEKVDKAVSYSQNTTNDIANNVIPKRIVPNFRENVVLKATEFLLAEKMRDKPMDRKLNFLRSKGLTEREIQESLNRVSAISYNQNSYLPGDNSVPSSILPPHVYGSYSNISGAIQTPYESQSWFRRLIVPIAFATTVAYIGYQIYKKYIENWLFVKKKSPLEIRLEAVELSMQRCIILLEEKNNASEFSNEATNRSVELDYVRAELKSIKSLLLNRFQFPPAPASSSIPQWQLSKSTKPQVEPQNQINVADPQHSNQNSKQSANSTSSKASPTTHVVKQSKTNITDTVKDNHYTLNDSLPNGTKSDENSDKSNDMVHQINLSKDKANIEVTNQ